MHKETLSHQKEENQRRNAENAGGLLDGDDVIHGKMLPGQDHLQSVAQIHNPGGQRLHRRQIDGGQIVIAPVPHQGEQEEDQQRGAGVGQHDPEKGFAVAAAVDERGFLQLGGDAGEHLPEHQDEQPARRPWPRAAGRKNASGESSSLRPEGAPVISRMMPKTSKLDISR